MSSGKAFKDLGVSAPEEALAMAELTTKLAAIIANRKLTQARVPGSGSAPTASSLTPPRH